PPQLDGRPRLGRGKGAHRGFYGQQEEAEDKRWQHRNNSNNLGNDAYSRFNENRGGGRRKDEPGEAVLDRSGWSSASSWAVRKTLPADVQDYYSKRERGGPGVWNRQEEEPTAAAAAADAPKSEAAPQTVPGNAAVPVLNVIPAQLNVLHHHYPMQGPPGALPVSLQPAAPYAIPPQVPVHLHPALPLLQAPPLGAQGSPPPFLYLHLDGKHRGRFRQTRPPSHSDQSGRRRGEQSQPLPSSTTQPGRAQADSSKKEKVSGRAAGTTAPCSASIQPKQQIQEKAISEVKTAIKPFYQRKEITKEEYKEIVRKAVEKVCHSKSGEVNSSKVANLVKAYVDKYKRARKK
uniref:SFR19-like C-terminal domain-containing protein n=1 Tax=Tetraodon nigroviridis TaxID=99883 RepID=H3CJQ9_TETNG